MMQLTKLRSVSKVLQLILGPVWKVTVFSKKEAEIEGTFDPPVAYIRARVFHTGFDVCADGEMFHPDMITPDASDQHLVDVYMLDIDQPPSAIAQQIIHRVTDINR